MHYLIRQNLYLIISLCFMGISAIQPAAAATLSLEDQRRIYSEARLALRKGNISSFHRLEKRITDYPLAGYLRYYYLRRHLAGATQKEVDAFLAANEDSPISEKLRYAWLRQLARRGKWSDYLNTYRDNDSDNLSCYRMQAQLRVGGKTQEVMNDIKSLWLSGKSMPKTCDRVFKVWRDSGYLTDELIWQRIDMAMQKRRLSLASYLAKSLKKSDRDWVERWRQMHRYPARMLTRKVFEKDIPVARKILLHGIKRLARKDAESASAEWERIKPNYAFEHENIALVERYIATSAALQRHPRALEWLTAIEDGFVNEQVQHWRIRTALSGQDWEAVLGWINLLPAEEQQRDQWQYWRARALEEQGLKNEAAIIYTALARDPDYHGFLAADRLSIQYNLIGQPIEYSLQELDQLLEVPAIQRARELHALGNISDARREWNFVTEKMDPRQLQVAAVIAHKWGWHDRVILTLGKSGHLDDLELRYPIVFRKQVINNASKQKVDPAWVYGVLRQESAFMTDARSHAGALGLMQLMPRTGRREARLIRSPIRHVRELLNVDKNIKLGTSHLRRVLQRHNGHHVLATASYNAGPQNVKKWLNSQPGDMAADVWVETIPFTETRRYLRHVMANTTIFEHRLQGSVTPLNKRMPAVTLSTTN